MRTVQELRKMLEGVMWEQFLDKDKETMERTRSKTKINGVTFYAKYGLHMQRPVIAVVACGHFISLIQVQRDAARDNHLPITPDSKYVHAAHYLYLSDFAPSRLTLHYLIDGLPLETTDVVIKELDK